MQNDVSSNKEQIHDLNVQDQKLHDQDQAMQKKLNRNHATLAQDQEKIASINDSSKPYLRHHDIVHNSIKNIHHSYMKHASKTAYHITKDTLKFYAKSKIDQIPFIKHAMSNDLIKDLVNSAKKNIHVNRATDIGKEKHYAYLLTEQATDGHRLNQSPKQYENINIEQQKAKRVHDELIAYIDQQSKGKSTKSDGTKFAPGIVLAGNEIAGLSKDTSWRHPMIGAQHRHQVNKLIKIWDHDHTVDNLYDSIYQTNIDQDSRIREKSFQARTKAISNQMREDDDFGQHRTNVASLMYKGSKKYGLARKISMSEHIQLTGYDRVKLRKITTQDPSSYTYNKNASLSNVAKNTWLDTKHLLQRVHVQERYPQDTYSEILGPVNKKLRDDPADKKSELKYEHRLSVMRVNRQKLDGPMLSRKISHSFQSQKEHQRNKMFAMELKRQQSALGHNF